MNPRTLCVRVSAAVLATVLVVALEDGAVAESTQSVYLPIVTRAYRPPHSVSVHVDARAGSTVVLDNISLTIPPAALIQDTTVTISMPRNGYSLGSDGLSFVWLGPSGLSLQSPATLTLSYGEASPEDMQAVAVYAFDERTGRWEQEPIVARDDSHKTVSVAISHFSWRVLEEADPIYVVPYIPGKFLDEGTILYTLTGCDDCGWLPGHVAIYSDTLNATLADEGEERIIESTQYGSEHKVWCSPFFPGGVRESTLSEFMYGGAHLYLGARSIAGADQDARRAARDYAASQLGKGYSVVGEGNLTQTCFSCVGLAEAAYDHAARQTGDAFDIIPGWQEIPFITPYQHYHATSPVIVIPVMSVVRVSDPWVAIHYEQGPPGSVTVSDLPEGASFHKGILRWTPGFDQLGSSYTMTLQASAQDGGTTVTQSQQLAITVVSGEVGIASIETRDAEGNRKSSFALGEDIAFAVQADNRSSEPVNAVLRWDCYDPDNARNADLSWDHFEVDLQPGNREWTLERGLPCNAQTGVYTFTASISSSLGLDRVSAPFTVTGGSSIRLLEATTCLSVDAEDQPIGVTDVFSTDDQNVYLWTKWSGACGEHTFRWRLRQPGPKGGSTITERSYVFTGTGVYYLWGRYPVHCREDLVGSLSIDVYMDDKYFDTVYLSLNSGGPCPSSATGSRDD